MDLKSTIFLLHYHDRCEATQNNTRLNYGFSQTHTLSNWVKKVVSQEGVWMEDDVPTTPKNVAISRVAQSDRWGTIYQSGLYLHICC